MCSWPVVTVTCYSTECWDSGLGVAGDSDVTKRALRCTVHGVAKRQTVCASCAARCVCAGGSQSVVFVCY